MTRDVIMTRLWESDEFIDDNTLTVNVARLRKKLEEAGMHDVIRTKKGIGTCWYDRDFKGILERKKTGENSGSCFGHSLCSHLLDL